MSFLKYLGYLKGINPQDEASHKHSKRLIDTLLLMDDYSKK